MSLIGPHSRPFHPELYCNLPLHDYLPSPTLHPYTNAYGVDNKQSEMVEIQLAVHCRVGSHICTVAIKQLIDSWQIASMKLYSFLRYSTLKIKLRIYQYLYLCVNGRLCQIQSHNVIHMSHVVYVCICIAKSICV